MEDTFFKPKKQATSFQDISRETCHLESKIQFEND